ncbi:MAG: ABC transporter permease [Chloroflexi bacterium]|nr:ABC transporter permease [Chloroflexota bacterium]
MSLSELPNTRLPVVVAPDPAATAKPSSLRRDTIRNILRQRTAVIGLIILGFLGLIALLAPFIAPYGPDDSMLKLGEVGTRGLPPCIHLLGCPTDQPQHLMGLDSNVRDEFSRVIFGSRFSLLIGFVTVSFAIVIGTLIGAVAGFAGGWLDNLLMRIMDVVLSFPSLILAIAIVTVLGTGLINAMLAIGIVSIPVYARVMRASVLSVRENDFVTASRALGESSGGILTRRILPNALTPLIVQGTLGIGGAILEVAALSFVGLGAQPPTAEWGFMIASDRNLFFSAPHLIFFPGVAITLSVLAFNLIGDGLRDALDPRLNR